MDLDRGLLEMIDEYVSDALAATGTRRAPRTTAPAARVVEPDPEPADLEPQTEPDGATLLVAVAQQLAHSVSAVPPLARSRAPRSTADLDDEITAIVARPKP